MKNLYAIIVPVLLLLIPGKSDAQSVGFDGQVIGWSTINPANSLQVQGGIRYIPEINFELPVRNLTIDGEVSLNIWGSATYLGANTFSLDEKLDPYRAWIRLSGQQFDLRAGLQKINFGSARMLRPLMWFDQLDPKDPLQLTNGVYGLLGRYYFLNNANIWLWGLYGNNEQKGLELFPSEKNSFEFGGRVQLPLPIGEAAVTYHHRTADPDQVLPAPNQIGEFTPENRYAFDFKIDYGIGLWFEGALISKESDLLPLSQNTLLNAGLDYTFNIGNGLGVMSETFYYMQGNKPFESETEILFTGLSVNYPLNIIHQLSAIAFYDISNNEFYRFINWSMTYDRWTFYTMAFWNPSSYQLYNFRQETNLFGGIGFQLMAVFNY